MADTSIFEINSIDADLYNYVKIREKAVLNDSIILKCLVYSNGSPVDLDNFNVEYRAVLPISNNIYSEVDNVVKSGNELIITCDSILTSEIGEVISYLRLWNSETKQKSTYQIIIKVLSTIPTDQNIAEKSVLSALFSLDMAINKYIELKADLYGGIDEAQISLNNLNNSISTSETAKTNLDTSITNANSTKTSLDNSNTTALNTKNSLDASITNANTLKTNLDTSITNATNTKTNLDASNSVAQTTKAELQGVVDQADIKLQEFKSFDTSQIVEKANTMIDKLYCNNELISIPHNLNDYPIVQAIYTSSGYGIGGYGEQPYGGNDSFHYFQCETKYSDMNNLTIYVPSAYVFDNPVLHPNLQNPREYTVTFDNTLQSVYIRLK